MFSLKGTRIGRQKDNDFCYPDESSISANHARIYFNNGDFYLQDLASKAGTFIRIKKEMNINNNAIIQLSYEV